MPPAARLTDMHVCPMVTGAAPHVGGPIIGPCVPTVQVAFLPASVLTDACLCNGPVDRIVSGSATVKIGGRSAARLGDRTAHGGVIVTGALNVIIGG